MPSELAALKQELRMVGEPIKIADRQIHVGYRKGEKIVLAQSGSGQIPAAITTQAVLQRFKVDRLISIGPAGNLRDDWKVGDVLIATDIIHYEAGSEKSAGFILKEPAKVKADYLAACGTLREMAVDAARGQNVRLGRIASGDKFIATGPAVSSPTEAGETPVPLFAHRHPQRRDHCQPRLVALIDGRITGCQIAAH